MKAQKLFDDELMENIRKTIKNLKRGGVTAMGMENLRQVTPTPKATDGAPEGGNLQWQYARRFERVLNAMPEAKKFVTLDSHGDADEVVGTVGQLSGTPKTDKATATLPTLTKASNAIKCAINHAHRIEADNRPLDSGAICHALWNAKAELQTAVEEYAALVAAAKNILAAFPVCHNLSSDQLAARQDLRAALAELRGKAVKP